MIFLGNIPQQLEEFSFLFLLANCLLMCAFDNTILQVKCQTSKWELSSSVSKMSHFSIYRMTYTKLGTNTKLRTKPDLVTSNTILRIINRIGVELDPVKYQDLLSPQGPIVVWLICCSFPLPFSSPSYSV